MSSCVEKGHVSGGPWGGEGGCRWDDGVYCSIRQLIISHGSAIDSIQIEYDTKGCSVWSEKHGGSGGLKTDKLKIDHPKEHLVSVSGCYGPVSDCGPVVVRSLLFETNCKTYGPFGTHKGSHFSFSLKGGKIVGFFGRSGTHLDCLGVYLKPFVTVKTGLAQAHGLGQAHLGVGGAGGGKGGFDIMVGVREKMDNILISGGYSEFYKTEKIFTSGAADHGNHYNGKTHKENFMLTANQAHHGGTDHKPYKTTHHEDTDHKLYMTAHHGGTDNKPYKTAHEGDSDHKLYMTAHHGDTDHKPYKTSHHGDIDHKLYMTAHHGDTDHKPYKTSHHGDIDHKLYMTAHHGDIDHKPYKTAHHENTEHKLYMTAHHGDTDHKPYMSVYGDMDDQTYNYHKFHTGNGAKQGYFHSNRFSESNESVYNSSPTIPKMPPARGVPAVSYGPWGGNGGMLFDDGVFTGIREIHISRSGGVVSLRVCYDMNGRAIWGDRNGGNGALRVDKITFDYPNEYLTRVSGYYGSMIFRGPTVVKSLTFFTNKNKYGPFGDEQGIPFSTGQREGIVVGFHGRKGWFLDSIGVHFLEGKLPRHASDMYANTTIADTRFTADQVVSGPVKGPTQCGPQSGGGPWGGNSGCQWDDGVFTGIRKIFLTKGCESIHAIQIEYDCNGNSMWLAKHGNNNEGSCHVIKLDYPHEILTYISGYYGSVGGDECKKAVKSLTFHTNRGSYGPYGAEIGTYFASPKTQTKIVGFHGNSACHLYAIGVHTQYWSNDRVDSGGHIKSMFQKIFA